MAVLVVRPQAIVKARIEAAIDLKIPTWPCLHSEVVVVEEEEEEEHMAMSIVDEDEAQIDCRNNNRSNPVADTNSETILKVRQEMTVPTHLNGLKHVDIINISTSTSITIHNSNTNTMSVVPLAVMLQPETREIYGPIQRT